jgi:hypothetical protein
LLNVFFQSSRRGLDKSGSQHHFFSPTCKNQKTEIKKKDVLHFRHNLRHTLYRSGFCPDDLKRQTRVEQWQNESCCDETHDVLPGPTGKKKKKKKSTKERFFFFFNCSCEISCTSLHVKMHRGQIQTGNQLPNVQIVHTHNPFNLTQLKCNLKTVNSLNKETNENNQTLSKHDSTFGAR